MHIVGSTLTMIGRRKESILFNVAMSRNTVMSKNIPISRMRVIAKIYR